MDCISQEETTVLAGLAHRKQIIYAVAVINTASYLARRETGRKVPDAHLDVR